MVQKSKHTDSETLTLFIFLAQFFVEPKYFRRDEKFVEDFGLDENFSLNFPRDENFIFNFRLDENFILNLRGDENFINRAWFFCLYNSGSFNGNSKIKTSVESPLQMRST